MKKERSRPLGACWILLMMIGYFGISNSTPSICSVDDSLPRPTYRKTKCRLLINEMDLYTQDGPGQQFIELSLFCPNLKSPQRAHSMKGVKLVIISHDGYLHGSCNLDGDLVPFKVITEKDKSTATPRREFRHWLFVIGRGYQNINYNLDDCELTTIGPDEDSIPKIRHGTEYPYAIGLLYSEKDNLKNIKLNKRGDKYVKTKMTPEIETRIRTYLQDFLIYGSQTKYQYCSYFDTIYKYQPNKYILVRDWNIRGEIEKSMSRCSTHETNSILPMQPHLFYRTNPTPGKPNSCATGMQFYIEDSQTELEHPYEHRYGELNQFKCLAFTVDEANFYLAVTSAENYLTALRDFESRRTPQILDYPNSQVISNVVDNEEVLIFDVNVEEIVVESDVTEVELSQQVSQKDFEDSLEAQKPYIWDNCDRFDEHKRQELRNVPANAIDEDVVLQPGTCNWFEYIKAVNKFRCRLCHLLLKQNIIFDTPDSRRIKSIMREGYMNLNQKNRINENKKQILNHQASIFHQMATSWFELYDNNLRGKELEDAYKKPLGPYSQYMQATKNFMITVKHSVRLGIPFRKFQTLTELLVYFDVSIGTLFQNFQGMKVATEVISEQMHTEFCSEMIERKLYFTILVDSTTDIQTLPVTSILFQTYSLEKGTEIKLYRILKLEKGESGKKLFDAFKQSIIEDGLQDYVRKYLHAVSSDGAPNIYSVFTTHVDTITNEKILAVWCHNHIYDLVYKRVVQKHKVLENVATVINACSRFFKKSPKRKEVLASVARDNGVQPYTIKNVHKIRWVNGNIRSFLIVLENWPYIIKTLEIIRLDTSFEVKVRERAEVLLSYLKSPSFITSLAFLSDVGTIFKYISLEYQRKGNTIIAKKALRNQFKSKLESMKNTELKSVKALFINSFRVDVTTGQRVRVEDLQSFETFEVIYHGVPLLAPQNPTEGNRLFEKQSTYLEEMIKKVDFYFPVNTQDLYEILNPLNFPEDTEFLDTYGKTEIQKLNLGLKWGYNKKELLKSWKALLKGITEHEEFSTRRMDRPEIFWGHYLSIGPEVGFVDITKQIIHRALSISSSNAASERILGSYKRVKTFQNYMIQPKTVESILRIRLNSDNAINEPEALKYAESFVKAGHSRSDAMKRRVKQMNIRDWDDAVIFDENANRDDDDEGDLEEVDDEDIEDP